MEKNKPGAWDKQPEPVDWEANPRQQELLEYLRGDLDSTNEIEEDEKIRCDEINSLCSAAWNLGMPLEVFNEVFIASVEAMQRPRGRWDGVVYVEVGGEPIQVFPLPRMTLPVRTAFGHEAEAGN